MRVFRVLIFRCSDIFIFYKKCTWHTGTLYNNVVKTSVRVETYFRLSLLYKLLMICFQGQNIYVIKHENDFENMGKYVSEFLNISGYEYCFSVGHAVGDYAE